MDLIKYLIVLDLIWVIIMMLIKNNNSELDIVFSIDKTIRDGRIFPQLKLKDIKAKNIKEIL